MKKDFLQTIKIIILGLLLSTGISYAASIWGSPTANFPVGNKSTPINTSSSPQGIGQPFLGSLLHINGNKILGNLRSNGLAIFGNATIGSDLTVKNFIGAGDRTVCADIDGNIIVCPVAVVGCGTAGTPPNNTFLNLFPSSPGLCSSGSATNFITGANSWIWTCGTASCSATKPTGPFPLTVTNPESGSGTITSNPVGISCD